MWQQMYQTRTGQYAWPVQENPARIVTAAQFGGGAAAKKGCAGTGVLLPRRGYSAEQEMNDDLILEIIARLPLKYAVQCSVLNKNICRRFISHPDFLPHHSTIFYCSNHNPKIFTTISQAIRSRTVHPLRRSVTLKKLFSIKASCNGLLLLQLRESSRNFFIFNPTTGEITNLGDTLHQNFFHGSVGLAVTKSGMKLVQLLYGERLYFNVLVPGSRGGVHLKPQVSYQLGFRIDGLPGDPAPVYANGNLYWLGKKREGGKVTVAFDVEKKKGRIITGPMVGNEVTKWWFGSAENSIYFVYSLASEMVILTLITDKWDVMHRVSKPREYDDDDEPLFFDGWRLLFVLRKRGEGADIYRYDLVMDVWEKIESLESWKEGYKLKFFSYISTFVKVSSSAYPDEKHVEREYRLHDFLVLQKLLTPVDDRPIHKGRAGISKHKGNQLERKKLMFGTGRFGRSLLSTCSKSKLEGPSARELQLEKELEEMRKKLEAIEEAQRIRDVAIEKRLQDQALLLQQVLVHQSRSSPRR